MRIISGKMKGRKLISPKNDDVRPTADKVKEAVFSMIGEHLKDAVIFDLFAGSGCLGLEALSRGAKTCYYCDNSTGSIRLIKENIKICGADSQSEVFVGDFKKALSKAKEKADVIFLDPPYEAGLIVPCIEAISELDILNDSGLIVCEHGKKEALPDEIFGFYKYKEKKYGSVIVSIYTNGRFSSLTP